MLTSEQAHARLKESKLPNTEDRIRDGIGQLPSGLRKPVAHVFSTEPLDVYVQRSAKKGELTDSKAVLALDRLSKKDRAKVFSLVSPGLARAMEQTWQLLKTLPYHQGYIGLAFRAPHHPELLAQSICAWGRCMAALGKSLPPETLTPEWLAAWAPHLEHGFQIWGADFSPILAAVVSQNDVQGDEVFEILRLSLLGQHEIGGAGQHIFRSFLMSSRPDAWQTIEKTLLAAQRQEGVRQAILQAINRSNPQALPRMLRLILERDLLRFSAVVQALDVWFGYLLSGASPAAIKLWLQRVIEFLENPASRDKALRGSDAEQAFLALWCLATEDAMASVPPAKKLLAAKSPELRYVGALHLVSVRIEAAAQALAPAIDDADLRIATLALDHSRSDESWDLRDDRYFERVEGLVARLPETVQKLKPLVWQWTETTVQRQQAARCLINGLGKRPATRLLPYMDKFDAYFRRFALEKLAESKSWNKATRQALIDLVGDPAVDVRCAAIAAWEKVPLNPAELVQVEGYLARKAGDLRRGVLELLLKQADSVTVASAKRLLTAKDAKQRLAGLELLRLSSDANRARAECRDAAVAYQSARKKLSCDEQTHLNEILKEKVPVVTLDDALGLMNAAERTLVSPPQNRQAPFITPAAIACLKALDDLIHENRDVPIRFRGYDREYEYPLGTPHWGFPYPDTRRPPEKETLRLPLAELWTKWCADRGKQFRDRDGSELVRAFIWCEQASALNPTYGEISRRPPARETIVGALIGSQAQLSLRYRAVIQDILKWLLYLFPCDPRDYLLDATETAYALVPRDDLDWLQKKGARAKSSPEADDEDDEDDEDMTRDWRDDLAFTSWSGVFDRHTVLGRQPLTGAQQARLWRLMHWHDQPTPSAPRRRVAEELLLAAYAEGAASLADVADHLLGPREETRWGSAGFGLLTLLTARKKTKSVETWLAKHPEADDLVQRAVERILEVELNRGDAPTTATSPAQSIGALYGAETLRRILHTLGKDGFSTVRGWRSNITEERRYSLTELAKLVFPRETESPGEFCRIMKAAVAAGQFPEGRLLQLTFLAPQWTKQVEAYIGWENMSEGVYWFLAHMQSVGTAADNAADSAGEVDDDEEIENNDDSSFDDERTDDSENGRPPKKLSAWDRLILERTPLTEMDRHEGAIDVAWFRRTSAQLGDQCWRALADAARFAANSTQARRAQFIADVLQNKVKRQELIGGIKKKQLKEHVRLLGLLPLAPGKQRENDLLERCQVLRDYRHYANQLSGLTKPAAVRAWEIGMKNLAQTAGYADALRLEWAVGGEAVKDLAAGPVSVNQDGTTVTLSLDDFSAPVLTVRKGDKELKSIPPKLKKDKKIAALTSRVTDLKRQASAFRQSLEAAMCRGDTFTGDELRAWFAHAQLMPCLSRLVVVGEGIMGYPDKGGKALRDLHGKFEPVKQREMLRLAHPLDLLESRSWHDWQRECFQAERVQPFKQVFRELYVLTKQEKKDGTISHRYAGQQIQPRQALALFGRRGWNTDGEIFKVFHDAGITASVEFESGWGMPGSVEGSALDGVSFRACNEWKPLKLTTVPSRLLSEVMRDLDLVISVAHAGGVDPEASASTVEMRCALLRETCDLLDIKNVRFKSNHALIDGELANYSLHLGSGVVHRLPGGFLCIVPVQAQQRGRLFLPFADNDPRTAEIISKALLLARDREIQDPSILEQIRR